MRAQGPRGSAGGCGGCGGCVQAALRFSGFRDAGEPRGVYVGCSADRAGVAPRPRSLSPDFSPVRIKDTGGRKACGHLI